MAPSSRRRRWLRPPPQRTAYFSRSRQPGVVLRVSKIATGRPRTASTNRAVSVAMPESRRITLSAVRSDPRIARERPRTTARRWPGTTRSPSFARASTVASGSRIRTVGSRNGSPQRTPSSFAIRSATLVAPSGTSAFVVASPFPRSSASAFARNGRWGAGSIDTGSGMRAMLPGLLLRLRLRREPDPGRRRAFARARRRSGERRCRADDRARGTERADGLRPEAPDPPQALDGRHGAVPRAVVEQRARADRAEPRQQAEAGRPVRRDVDGERASTARTGPTRRPRARRSPGPTQVGRAAPRRGSRRGPGRAAARRPAGRGRPAAGPPGPARRGTPPRGGPRARGGSPARARGGPGGTGGEGS